MVYYDLLLKVKCGTAEAVWIEGTGYQWVIEVECGCGQVHETIFTEEDEAESDNTKVTGLNYAKKCKECKYNLSISVYPKSGKSILANKDKQVLCSFDFRNCTPIKWKPTPGFHLRTEAESTFTEVELSEDWTEYDEKGECPVEIEGIESEFKRNNKL